MCTFSYVLKQSGLTKAEMARVLGIPPSAITTRLNGTNDIKISELVKIENRIGHKIFRPEGAIEYDQVRLPYIEIEGEDNSYYVHPNVQHRVQFDREIVEKIWALNPDNLRIMTMHGNNMNAGNYPLRNNDILVIDISGRDISRPGIYVYKSAKSGVTVSGIQQKQNGSVTLINLDKKYPDEEYTAEELSNIDFKIIGRVVNNLSLIK